MSIIKPLDILKNNLALLLFVCFSISYAQNETGHITYMSHKKMNLKLDSTKYDRATIKRTQDIFAKQFQHEYVLEYNKTKSLYSKKRKLILNGTSTFNNDKLFKNFNTKVYTHKQELLGKVFLVKDLIKPKNWTITNETKTIGKYVCQKAIYNRIVNDSIVKVIAWFTTDIPINNGPGIYDGLPGLILQITDDDHMILCTKIELNKEVRIKEPKGGKKVNQKEYDLIFQEKKREGLSRAKSFREGVESSKN